MPPPYNPTTKKNNTTLIIVLVVAALAVCCIGGIGLAGFGVFRGYQAVAPFMECALDFTQVRNAMLKYAEAHEGKLPPAENWQAAIQPYLADATTKDMREARQVMRLKPLAADGDWGCANGDSRTGMAYNSDVAGKTLDSLTNKSQTPLLFEVPQQGRSLAMPYTKQDDSQSPMIFNERRGWMVAPVQGEVEMGNEKVKVDVGS